MTNQHPVPPAAWQPARRDIENATVQLRYSVHQAQTVARRSARKDLYALDTLAEALSACLPVLPPEVAALAREVWQTIQDAYAAEQEER